MNTDLSGFFTLAEISSVQGLMQTISKAYSFTYKMFEVYDRAQIIIGLLKLTIATYRILMSMVQPTQQGIIESVVMELQRMFGLENGFTVTKAFNEVFKAFGTRWRQELEKIPCHIPEIAAAVSAYVAIRLPSYIAANKLGKLKTVIYLPTGPGSRSNDAFITLGDIQIAFSATGGRLFGLGIRIGKNDPEQLFRIDYWDTYFGPPTVRLHYHSAPNLSVHHRLDT